MGWTDNKGFIKKLLVGSPNVMNDSSTHDNYLTYLRYNNHGTIDKNLVKAKKTLNEEVKINIFFLFQIG